MGNMSEDEQIKEKETMEIVQSVNQAIQNIFIDKRKEALVCLKQIQENANSDEELIMDIDKHWNQLWFVQGTLLELIEKIEYKDIEDANIYFVYFKLVFNCRKEPYGSFLLEITKQYENKFYKEMPEDMKRELDLLKANCYATMHENAMAGIYYRKAIQSYPANSVSAGWANLGFSNLYSFQDSKRLELLKSASEAFLLNGMIEEYIRTEIKIVHYYKQLKGGRQEVLEKANELLSLMQDEQKYKNEYDTVLRMKISFLMEHCEYQSAMDCVESRLQVSENYFGTEFDDISFIYFGLMIAEQLCDDETKSKYLRILQVKESRLSIFKDKKQQYEARQEILGYLRTCNYEKLSLVQLEGEDTELYWTIPLMQSLSDKLSNEEKMEKIQEALSFVEKQYEHRVDYLEIIYARMAYFYEKIDNDECLKYCEKVLTIDNFHMSIIKMYLSGLRNTKNWKKLLAFCEQQIELLGEEEAYLILAGEAALNLKDYDSAVSYLKEPSKSSEYANKLLHTSLDKGGHSKDRKNSDTVKYTLQDIKEALYAFQESVQNESRMCFWHKDSKDKRKYHWVAKPESLGKLLLQTSLKGCFRDNILTIEECGAGAGRIDLYLNLDFEISILVELKMCGEGYSSNYALHGFEQLNHYMKARKVGVGYLIIFDARKRDFGKGISEASIVDGGIIYTLVIDVRNNI